MAAEISRANPAFIMFLLDQSDSMKDPFKGGAMKKSEGVADAINRALYNIVLTCNRDDGVRDYFYISVIGYGASVGSAFLKANLADKERVPISLIADNAESVPRQKRESDGAGGVFVREIDFKTWINPVASNGTPMGRAFRLAHDILQKWLAEYPNSFPPIVVNITDGKAGDDPIQPARDIMRLKSNAGSVMLFNAHLADENIEPCTFPSNINEIPQDEYAQMLYNISSELTPEMLRLAQQTDERIKEGAKGFAYNADLVKITDFINVGSNPANFDLER